MDELEYLCEDLSQDATNQDFRLWLTTTPTKSFSVPTLQLGVKVAIEEPTTVKTSLARHLFPDKAFIAAYNNKSAQWQKVCFAISLFHSCINERTTYAHCGWNQDYIFGEADYDLCMLHLNSIMKSGDCSLSTLHYLIADCTYGGKMEDEWDMRTLDTFLKLICSKLNKQEVDSPFDPDGLYHTNRLREHETLMEYIGQLPTETSHKMMRVNEPNHWNRNQTKGVEFISKLRLTQGLDMKNDDDEEESNDKAMREKILSIMERTPKEFELSENLQEILTLVLDQELQKYNNLLSVMRETLENVLNGLDGKNLVTVEIEEFLDSLRDDEIPRVWMDNAYPTMENLEGFLQDLSARTDFLHKWHTDGSPDTYWMTALFEPGDFLIAIMYISAVETGKAFHELSLECRFDTELGTEGPGILARGLYLVGAAWDEEKNVLKEADRKDICCRMPVVRLVPVHTETSENGDEEEGRHTFQCPLFQNSERSGDENFIIDVDLPSEVPSETWILRGTALLCQRPIETVD